MPTLDHILSDSGPIARLLGENFEPRPQQLEMARAVAQAMDHGTHLLVEAGTGVGKSFAYLVPAVLRCLTRGETVVIATNTISLQEQLIEKDIPLLERVVAQLEAAGTPLLGPEGMPRVLKPVLVKGRGNYISLRRLSLAHDRRDRLFSDAAQRRSLDQIRDWAMTTKDGTLSTLPQLEKAGVWDKVQSDSGNCMGRKCPRYNDCFYQKARRELDGANLLICNHAMFFSDLALRSQDAAVGVLPEYHHVILDEAHNVEEVASDHFGVSLSEGRVNHLLSTLYHQRTGRGYLPQLGMAVQDNEPVERAIALVQQAQDASRAFFDSLTRLSDSGEEKPWTDAEPAKTTRIRKPGAITNVLTQAMRDLSLRLSALKDLAKQDPDRYELNSYSQRAEMIAVAAEALVSQRVEGAAYWVEVEGNRNGGTEEGSSSLRSSFPSSSYKKITFACSPVEVGPILKERLFRAGEGKPKSVTLTSATLATRTTHQDESTEHSETAFAHIMARLGCEGAKTLQLGSPFDYANQVEFFVSSPPPPRGEGRGGAGGRHSGPQSPQRPTEAPEDLSTIFDDYGERVINRNPPSPSHRFTASPSQGHSRAFRNPLSTPILHHIEQTRGGAFILFTSFATLNSVARDLAGPLAQLGYPMLAQGRDGSRTHILQRFREDPTSVLLGAASFWQGVDVRGDALRNVIITKLPFDPPDRPLTQARYELIESRGGNSFMEDSLPRAIIKFKQGFGRLIRSKTDHGRVVVLDPRILTARYGRLFVAALPEGVRVRGPGFGEE
jgi:ATP-dependent DNA helicase DinG